MFRAQLLLLPFASLSWLASAHAAEAVDAAALHQQLVAELQSLPSDAGVELRLGTAWYELGRSLQQQGRHDEAVAAFDQALDALRKNKGLYDLDQLPVLQARLDSSEALEGWREVDAGRQLAYFITLRNPEAGVERRYQALRELGLWKLHAAEEELLPNALADARAAATLYRQELEQENLRADYAGRPLQVANLYLDLAALELLQARQKLALPLSEYYAGGQRTEVQVFCETIATPDGRTRQVCRSLQVPSLDYFMGLSDRKYDQIRDHLDAMKAAVLEAYDVLLPQVETQDRADALALLGEVHRLTDAFNEFVAENARKTESRIASPTGSLIRR